jgi:hypothetical protein
MTGEQGSAFETPLTQRLYHQLHQRPCFIIIVVEDS